MSFSAIEKKEDDIGFEYQKPRKISEQMVVLEQFTSEQQAVIIERLKILSVIPKIIGRDFDMPVELNTPNGGWHWNFKENVVKVDPVDLLEKPIDYLRFVMAHEGGHRRILQTDFIPLKIWKQKGFSFLMNVIEDPRDNNFLADTYPRFREEASMAYDINNAMAEKMKAKAKDKLGMIPRFELAGHEFIRLWYSWFKKESMVVDGRLPTEVQEIVKKTLVSAEDAWSRYPSKEEIDGEDGTDTVRAFAKVSYEIILEEIWPEFQKLIQQDLEDQKLEEYLKQLEKEKQEKKDSTEQKEFGDGEKESSSDSDLTPEEQEELEKALEKAIEEATKGEKSDTEKESSDGQEGEGSSEKAGQESDSQKTSGGKPIPLDPLSPELKEKLRQKIASLSEEEKKDLAEKAEKAIAEIEKDMNKELQGEMTEDPEQKALREAQDKAEKQTEEIKEQVQQENTQREREKEAEDTKKRIEKIKRELYDSSNEYEKAVISLMPEIAQLEDVLRDIFLERKKSLDKVGFVDGDEWDFETRLQEKMKNVSVFESRAWRRIELPREKDYAISLLVDLSGSMGDSNKIEETFKAVVLFAEVLDRLGISMEIIGFNDCLYEYKKFTDRFDKDRRESLLEMFYEVRSGAGKAWNDDGWALGEVEKRLEIQKQDRKIMIVLSDGEPVPSDAHNGPEFNLKEVVKEIVS
jgi:hypothetical protein